MPSKYNLTVELSKQTARDLSSSPGTYMSFLITAANNYKYSFTDEAAVAKLMWIMGETRDPDRVRERFYSPVSHDILYTEAE